MLALLNDEQRIIASIMLHLSMICAITTMVQELPNLKVYFTCRLVDIPVASVRITLKSSEVQIKGSNK